jgi:hypothetical protein
MCYDYNLALPPLALRKYCSGQFYSPLVIPSTLQEMQLIVADPIVLPLHRI